MSYVLIQRAHIGLQQGIDGFCGFLVTDTSVLGFASVGALAFLGLMGP